MQFILLLGAFQGLVSVLRDIDFARPEADAGDAGFQRQTAHDDAEAAQRHGQTSPYGVEGDVFPGHRDGVEAAGGDGDRDEVVDESPGEIELDPPEDLAAEVEQRDHRCQVAVSPARSLRSRWRRRCLSRWRCPRRPCLVPAHR